MKYHGIIQQPTFLGLNLLLITFSLITNGANASDAPTSSTSAIPSHEQLFELPNFINHIIDTRILPLKDKRARLLALLDFVYKKDQLNLQYANDITRTPMEAIAQRKGNCVTLSFTFAAMARRANLKVNFMESSDPGRWRKIGENYALERHMSLYLPIRTENTRGYHVDFQYAEPAKLRHKKMSDKRAIGDYYSNRAIESLQINKLDLALEFSKLALDADNKYDASWLNYGLILRRHGDLDAAIAAYHKALKLNSHNPSIYNNLAVAYEAQGNKRAAEKMMAKTKKHRLKNPFYLYTRGELAVEKEKYSDAILWIKKAIKKEGDIAPFYLGLAEAYYLNNQLEQALKTLQKGLTRATQAHIKSRIYNTIEFIKSELLQLN